MNYGDFAAKVNILKSEHPELRIGQAMMIALHDFNPEFYLKITGTGADCFYDDKKTPQFISALWDELSNEK